MIKTQAGQLAIANALAGTGVITVQHMAFGTSDRQPDGTEVALSNEVLRKPVILKETEENGDWTVFTALMEAADGPFILYEIGLFDDAGGLLFIGRLEGFSKIATPGIAMDGSIRVFVATSDLENVTIEIDSISAAVPPSRRIIAGEGTKGGGDFTEDREIALDVGGLPAQTGAAIDLAGDGLALFDADFEGDERHAKISTNELSNALLRTQAMIDAHKVEPSVDGPSAAYVDADTVFTITDYHAWATWAVAVNVGSVARDGAAITVTLPSGTAATEMTLTVTRDGVAVVIDLDILTMFVEAPVIQAPTNGATNVSETPVLVSSVFGVSPVGADTHASTDWQIATDAGFSSITYQAIADATNLETLDVPAGELSENTTYYVRARHNGTTLGASAYSATVSFTTLPLFGLLSEVQKLVASDGTASAYLGMSLASGDGYVFGGGQAHVGASPIQGAVYAYKETAGVWVETQKIVASDGAQYDQFGDRNSVAFGGGWLVVGAEKKLGGGHYASGCVYAYTLVGGVWAEQQIITPSVHAQNLYFGAAVWTDGATLAVGAPGVSNSAGPPRGRVYFYEMVGGVWTNEQIVEMTLTAGYNQIGHALAGDGIWVAAGGHFANSGAGAVHVIENVSGTWTEQQVLTGSDTAAGDYFGGAVDMIGPRLVVGAERHNGFAGAAYEFTETGGTWAQTEKIVPGDNSANDGFGHAVLLGPSTLIVGANAAASPITYSGAFYKFRESGGAWTQLQRAAPAGIGYSDGFGYAASSDGTKVFFGAISDDDVASGAGAIYVWEVGAT